MQELAEPAVVEHALRLLQRRLEAPVVADGERDLLLRAGRHRLRGALRVDAERLLDEDMFAGLCRGDDLLAVKRMRRRQHHRIDLAVGEHLFVALHQADALLLAVELRRRRRARRAGDEADQLALALHRLDQIASPGADADDRCADHCNRQRPCFSNQYTMFPVTTMLPETTALAAVTAPAATRSCAH